MSSKRKVKVIRAKKWETEEALEKAVRAFLDRKPDSDQLDVADACGVSLRRACEVLDRLVAARKVMVWACQKCGKPVEPAKGWTHGSIWCSLECSDC